LQEDDAWITMNEQANGRVRLDADGDFADPGR